MQMLVKQVSAFSVTWLVEIDPPDPVFFLSFQVFHHPLVRRRQGVADEGGLVAGA